MFYKILWLKNLELTIIILYFPRTTTMEGLVKGIALGVAALAAAVLVAVEWLNYRNVPQAYSTHGQKRRRD